MTKAILHIGTHKTGTTALQDFLYDNAAELDRRGITYYLPKRKYQGISRTRNGYFLCRYAKAAVNPGRDEADYAPLTEENLAGFRETAAHAETVLLSDERIWYQGSVHPESWRVIKGLLEDSGVANTQVIVYFRRQDQFIASLWNQWVKGRTRMCLTLDAYAQRRVSVAIMDYWAGLQEVERVFGAENVAVRVYERDRLVDGDIRADFCQLVGIDTAGLDFRARESNPGLNANIAEVKRQANCVPEYQVADNFLSTPAVAATLASDARKSSVLTPELSARILSRFEEGNERIARERLGRPDGALFAPVAPSAGSSSAFADDAIRFFAAALTQEHNRLVAAEQRIAELEARVNRKGLVRRLAGRLKGKVMRPFSGPFSGAR